MSGTKPIKVFRAGAVRAAVWRDTITRNGVEIVVHNVQIDRTFKDGDEYKSSSSFDAARDVPRLLLVASKAYEFVALKAEDEPADADA